MSASGFVLIIVGIVFAIFETIAIIYTVGRVIHNLFTMKDKKAAIIHGIID